MLKIKIYIIIDVDRKIINHFFPFFFFGRYFGKKGFEGKLRPDREYLFGRANSSVDGTDKRPLDIVL